MGESLVIDSTSEIFLPSNGKLSYFQAKKSASAATNPIITIDPRPPEFIPWAIHPNIEPSNIEEEVAAEVVTEAVAFGESKTAP